MFRTVAKGGIWHGEICNRSKDGSLYWVDTTIAPLFNDAGKLRGYFAIRADITSLKQAQVLAESASRSKSEFLANMSHEIRTPMTAILGYADLLAEERERGFESASTLECISTIKRNGEHLLSIINDILDISKIEADKMTAELLQVSPVQLVEEVVELMQVKSNSKRLRLTRQFDDDIPEIIITDPTRLRQILVNLVGNAIKFTEAGSVTIVVRMHDENPEQICFDVIDTGIGIGDEQLTKLFQSFEQGDSSMTRKFGGTGLGLRISKRLAVMLGGDITAACSVNGGCVFTATITTGCTAQAITRDDTPVARDHSPTFASVSETTCTPTAQALPSSEPKRFELAGYRVLLVEDGPDNQRLVSYILRKAGATVEIVENGKLAVERCTIDGSTEGTLIPSIPFDLVLMDMQMPEMDGYEAAQLLRSKGCKIPILALTAHAMEIEQAKCLAAGCDFRLTKPIDKASLLEACDYWLRRERLAAG